MRTPSALFCLLFALVGCSEATKMPPPAASDLLRESVYTFYKSYTEPGPSGVLVATRRNGSVKHLILTAGHVVKRLIPVHKVSGEVYLGFRSANLPNAVRRICAPTRYVDPFLHPDYPAEDLGAFLVRDLEMGVTANSGHVSPIDLDAPFANGVGIVRDSSDYEKYAISVGSGVFTFCSDITQPIDNQGYDWRDSVVMRKGRIRDLRAKLETAVPAKPQNAVIVDFPSVNGNSGGPVFAYGQVEGIRYPFLLGVVSGQVGANTNLTAVAPIGPIVCDIERKLQQENEK